MNRPHDDVTIEPRVRGGLAYTDDIAAEEGLFAAFVLSPEAHARIVSIDVTAALEVPGVHAVLTGDDLGARRFGRSLRDYPVLAHERVRFIGQRVAAVAAVNPETAQLGADLIDIAYEPLPVVLDPDAALADDAPVLHPGYDDYDGAAADRSHPNVQGEEQHTAGDAASAWADCEAVYEHRFTWARNHAAPIEPHTCLVAADERVAHVYSAHKEPFKLRRDLALLAGRPEESIVVHPIPIGGDFGAKGAPFIEGACYFLAMATGHPVRSKMSYYDELTTTTARHPGHMTLRTGLRDGRPYAHQARTVFDGGAFAGGKPRPLRVQPVIGVPLGPYQPEHRDERSVAAYTNSLPGGQVRSPGEFQATFTGESHIDMIARERGEDPLRFRLNCTRTPEARRVLEALEPTVSAYRDHPSAGSEHQAFGVGIAVFHRGSGAGRSVVRCIADRTGGVTLEVGAPDQGAGSYPTFVEMAARELHLPHDRITVRPVGAAEGLTDGGAGSSRVTAVTGRACVEACRALLTEVSASPSADSAPDWLSGRLAELERDEVVTMGEWEVTRSMTPTTAPAHGALAVEVRVDRLTGAVRVERAQLVLDAGPVLNPAGHRGQVEGGFVYGLSQALFEELIVEDGQIVTVSLGDYKLATAADIPPLQVELLEPEPVDGDPYDGLKAIGELTNLGVAPAIANAVDDAVGARVTTLPITAERIWAAMRQD